MATYKYDGKQWIGYNEFDTALEIVQKSKNNILYLESLHNTGMIEEELQQIRNQINEIRTELASLEMRTESIEETLPLKQDELSAGLAIGIYGTTIAVKLQDIAAKLDSVPTGAAITTSSADLIRVENKLYYKTETSVGGMTTYAYEELTNSELTERIVAQIPTDFKIDENGRLILVHDSNVIGAGVEIGGIGVTIDAPATATQGTLTATQLGILEASETNYIMFNHEKYYLMDKQHTSGSLTYSHVGADNQINHIKTFTITLSNLTWVLIDTEVGKSEPAITIVDSLPTPTEEEFEKHKIYLDGVVLKYIAKIALSNPNLSIAANMPYLNTNTTAAAVGLNIYIFGGDAGVTTSRNKILKFDTITNSITTLTTTLPFNLYSAASAAVGSNIYIFGGYTGEYQGYKNTILKFDTITNSITTLSATISFGGGSGVTAAAVGSNIYIFGGYDGTYRNGIRKFDTSTNSITSVSANLPQAMNYCSVASVGSNIYIFGGKTSSSTLDTILKFDTITNSITTLTTTLPQPIKEASCFAKNNYIYIVGGSTNGGTLDSIYRFDVDSESITLSSTTLNEPLEESASVIVDDSAYIIGGLARGTAKSSEIFRLQFGFTFEYKTITAQ